MPIYIYLQLLFFITELALLIFKRSKKASVKNNKDRRSLLILWVTIALCMSIGPYSAAAYSIWIIPDYPLVFTIGIIVFAIGFIIRWMAVYQLGKMFTVDVAIVDEHTLKTSGLYRIIRHPSYLGLILIIMGLAICLDSGLTFLIMTIPTFLAINHRINVEEKALIKEFGEQYTDYKTRVSKLIPGIY